MLIYSEQSLSQGRSVLWKTARIFSSKQLLGTEQHQGENGLAGWKDPNNDDYNDENNDDNNNDNTNNDDKNDFSRSILRHTASLSFCLQS